VGEHSGDIAHELGMTPAMIAELVAEGVLGLIADEAELPADARQKSAAGT